MLDIILMFHIPIAKSYVSGYIKPFFKLSTKLTVANIYKIAINLPLHYC